MRKLKNILFTMLLAFVSVFAIGNVSALNSEDIDKIYKSDSVVGVTSGTDKANVTILTGDALNSVKENLDHAAYWFYKDGFGSATHGYVQMVPMKVNVIGNIGDGNVQLYIKIPESMLTARGDVADSISHLRFSRLFNDPTNGYVFNPIFGIDGSGDSYRIDVDSNNDMSVIRGNLNGSTFTVNDAGDYYVSIKTNFKDYTDAAAAQGSELYYVLAICYSNPPVTTTTTIPTTVPTTITTTVENPKTLDGNNTMYIVLGVIGLMGVIGLGSKFAKSSK